VPKPAAPASRTLDLVVAAALVVATFGLLLSTNDIGFVRDEAFYFGHAETYQRWFVDVEAGGAAREAALGHEGLTDIWHHNREHPPLNKVLFGYTWRVFGRKLRDVGSPGLDGDDVVLTVGGLGPGHGFAEGARVRVLSPQLVGGSSSPEGRGLAEGVVFERTDRRARVRVTGAGAALIDALRETCRAAGPGDDGHIRRTGCEALELDPLHVLSESDAMRASAELFAGLLVALLYLIARGFFGGPVVARPFAVLAGAGYLMLPRPFYHAHLAVFDTTITFMVLLVTVVYARAARLPARTGAWRVAAWLVGAGVAWGLALLTKHNAFFLPVVFLTHWLLDGWAEGQVVWAPRPGWRSWSVAAVATLAVALAVHPFAGLAAGLITLAAAGARLRLPPVPLVYFSMVVLGPALLVAGWPWLWVDTVDHLAGWIEFHANHEHYMQHYFGDVLAYPPFPVSLPFVLTATTFPLTLLTTSLLGMGVAAWPQLRWQLAALRGGPDGVTAAVDRDSGGRAGRFFDRLLWLTLAWPIVLIALPSTPVFGGVKHWATTFCAMLLFSARGLDALWRQLGPVLAARCGGLQARPGQAAAGVLAWALVALAAVPAAQETWDVHPHGTAYYNALIGGIPGAADAGMQRQFWGGSTRSGLEEVNRRAPRNARVWFHLSAWGAFRMYQREGWFRRDLRYAGEPAGTSHGLYHHQKDHDDYELDAIRSYGTMAPIMHVAIEGVPLLSVYERPAARGR
jgi:hypothetical protein